MRAPAPLRAHAREVAFVLKLLPMLPSGAVDRLTPAPVVERIHYHDGQREVEADVFRPPAQGRYPGIVMCLGVVPFGVEHPQVPRLCDALARSGFVALIHWSDAMRDRRLVPEDALGVARAYDALLARRDVDAGRSGLFGTCVGGSFALLAAAHPLIRDRIRFVGAFAPFGSMWSMARDVASATRDDGTGVRPWEVDQLTRAVFERVVHDVLASDGAGDLFASSDRASVETALRGLPVSTRERLDAMSPLAHLGDIHAPCVMIGHDRDDQVIPVGESRRLAKALEGRAGAHYTEYRMFQHADPTQRHLSPLALARELSRFYASLHPMFRETC